MMWHILPEPRPLGLDLFSPRRSHPNFLGSLSSIRLCRSRSWDCTESGTCTSVSTSVSTVAANCPRASEMYFADH